MKKTRGETGVVRDVVMEIVADPMLLLPIAVTVVLVIGLVVLAMAMI